MFFKYRSKAEKSTKWATRLLLSGHSNRELGATISMKTEKFYATKLLRNYIVTKAMTRTGYFEISS